MIFVNDNCGDNATWILDGEGTLTISGTGAMYKSSFRDNLDIKKVVINPGISQISDEVFLACKNIEEVLLPNTIEIIGKSAFDRCEKLSNIILPSTLTYLGAYAFFSCELIQKIEIPKLPL